MAARKREEAVTLGVVNIFLGGTGKFIAEELKGQQSHYDLSLPDYIAFDLSRETTHTGAFALGHDLLAPHEQFASTATDVTAPRWESLNAGAGLMPLPPQPGPQIRPEAAVMSAMAEQMKVMPPPAEGLWGLRAAGLLAFATFMDPAASGPQIEAAVRFKDRLGDALVEAGKGGEQITVNIVASTAGGTGAGVFLPLALHLAGHPAATSLEINLVLVVSSAFDNLPVDAGPLMLELQTKGRSGTFAIIRELELLERADSRTSFANRRFPISTGNPLQELQYRPGSGFFHRVYWMGRRSMDVTARNDDVYRETDPLVRILSNRQAADDLDGQAGPYAQRLLPSIVTVDYPRLARARKTSSVLAEAAVQEIREGDDHPVSGRRFFQYSGGNPKAFGRFVQDNEFKAFDLAKGGHSIATRQEIDALVDAYMDLTPYRLDFERIGRGAARGFGGYLANVTSWPAYCASLNTDLMERMGEHERRIDEHTRERISAEGDQFRGFVAQVADEYLNPADPDRGPYPLSALQRQVHVLREDLESLETFFGPSRGIQGLLPDNAARHSKYRTPDEVKQRISTQERALLSPEIRTGWAGLSSRQWVTLLLTTVIAAVIGWNITIRFPGTLTGLWAVTLASAAVAAVAMFLVFRKRRIPLPQLRRREEDRLLSLYDDWAFAHTGHALMREVNDSFVPRVGEALDALDRRIGELKEVYDDLLLNARARAAEVFPCPLHSVGQVGSDLAAPAALTREFIAPLVNSVAIVSQTTQDGLISGLSFRIESPSGGAPDSGFVTEMANSIREQRMGDGKLLGAASRGSMDLASLDAAVDGIATTSLARLLPRSFQDALLGEAGSGNLAALDRHLAALVHKTPGGQRLEGQDRRHSAVECAAADAAIKRLYVPSIEVRALVVRCLQGEGGTLANSIRNELRDYMSPDGGPLVVPELGASIALLSIWVPDGDARPWAPTTIMATHEGERSHDTYYGLTPNAGLPGFIGGAKRSFHILPEVSAAAAIETAQDPATPLRTCVVARLLGSHPEIKGPTILELFYLLRADGAIRPAAKSSTNSIELKQAWEMQRNGHRIPLLEQPVLIGGSGDGDEFGGGRRIVNLFDAFHEFILYDGARGGAILPTPGLNTELAGGATVSRDAWSRNNIAVLQGDLIQRWWTCVSPAAVDDEHEFMDEILAEDVAAMEPGEAAADWERAVRHVLQRGRLKRRELAAATNAN